MNAQESLWALCGHKPINLLLSFQLILAARQVWYAPREETKMIQELRLHFIKTESDLFAFSCSLCVRGD